MLVLSRKRDESIVIDENIVVTVIEVRGDKVVVTYPAVPTPGAFAYLPVSCCVVPLSPLASRSDRVSRAHVRL